jgi:hypothetical protein
VGRPLFCGDGQECDVRRDCKVISRCPPTNMYDTERQNLIAPVYSTTRRAGGACKCTNAYSQNDTSSIMSKVQIERQEGGVEFTKMTSSTSPISSFARDIYGVPVRQA